MKRLKNLLGGLIAVALTVFSLQSVAADAQLSGRDFNHMSTGFMLSGGHAVAACETCHIGGVFKGTPRACDGCHANGKRIVATPKSNAHIVSDAQCDTCHFNTATFLGARYNHANATPGQCRTCHNGRLSMSKPNSHSTGRKATESCDGCHRSISWLPATWNHDATSANHCSDCHNGTQAPGKNHAAPVTTMKNSNQCDSCHTYLAWIPAVYKHNEPGTCSSCHNNSKALGKGLSHGVTTAECNTCHTNYISFLGASYHNGLTAGICGTCHIGGTSGVMGKPANHIPVTGNNCDLCHTSLTNFAIYTMNHAGNGNTATCVACHATGSAYPVLTKVTTGPSHQGSTVGQECHTCHISTSTWLGAGGAMPSNHIPYNVGTACAACHTTGYTAKVTVSILHANSSSRTCAECHISPNAYTGNNQSTKKTHKGSSGSNCTQSGCHTKAASYSGW
jgi:hypothetical protein